MDAKILELGHATGEQALLSPLCQDQFFLALLFLLQRLETNDLAAGFKFQNGLLQRGAVVPRFDVQQAHFEHVAHARQHFGQIEGLADEVLCAGLQRAELVARLGGQHEDREIVVLVDVTQAFHHLESVHARHLEIEEDETEAVRAVKLADLVRIPRGRNRRVAGAAQRVLEQRDIGRLIVDDQDAGVQDVGCADHWPLPGVRCEPRPRIRRVPAPRAASP